MLGVGNGSMVDDVGIFDLLLLHSPTVKGHSVS